MPSIVRYPANDSGRDFMVRDVHGRFRTPERTLATIQLDPATDRLFAVDSRARRGGAPAAGNPVENRQQGARGRPKPFESAPHPPHLQRAAAGRGNKTGDEHQSALAHNLERTE